MKKVEVITLTDSHLSKNTIEENISCFEQARKKAKELKLKKVHHIGDIFTNRSGLTLDVLIAFTRILEGFELDGIELIAIPGNHDKVHLNVDSSYLDIFKKEGVFTVHSSPTITEGFSDNLEIAFLPYYKEIDLYPEQLKKTVSLIKDKKKKTILLTHIAVNGVQNNDGSVIENDLDPNLFNNFHKVFIGHYHNRSQVGANIFYTGSAFPQNFGEDADKGFTLIYSDGSHEYFKPQFKEYIKLEVPFDQLEDFIKEESYTQLIEAGNQVRFIVSGEETQLKSFDKTRVTSLGFSIQLNDEKVEEHIQEVEEGKITTSFNMDTIILGYQDFCIKNSFDFTLGLKYLTMLKNGNL